MHRLAGKVAVVAGGAGGIGSATSLRLAREGASVMVGDLNAAGADAVAAQIRREGGNAVSIALDLADPQSIDALFDAAVVAFGGVDFLHCNGAAISGVHEDVDALELPLAVWDRTLATNTTSYLHCTRRALPLMLARGAGAIVYTSSGASYVPETVRVAYGVSKAGVNALARHVALRWGKEGIRANAIAPGLVMTPAADALPPAQIDAFLAATPSPRLGKPEDIAAMVAMLFSPDGEWINGQTYAVDGGMTMR